MNVSKTHNDLTDGAHNVTLYDGRIDRPLIKERPRIQYSCLKLENFKSYSEKPGTNNCNFKDQ